MKKRWSGVGLFLFLFGQGPVLAQEIPDLVAEQGFADMVLVNGKMVSMDDRSTVPGTPGHVFQAMAIKGKKIMALGTAEEMRKLAGSGTQFVDVGNRVVIPGLIQTHYHIYTTALRVFGPLVGLLDRSVKITLEAEADPEATAKKIRETILNAIRVQRIPKGQWMTVQVNDGPQNRNGTVRAWFNVGKLTRQQFDSALKDHPVMIRGRSAGVFNQVAIDEFTKEFPDWEESVNLEKDPAAFVKGWVGVPEMTGVSVEYWWKDEPLEKFAEALRLQGLELQKKGITTIATRLMYPRVIAAIHKLNRENRLPHRMAYYIESQRGNFWNLKSIREFYRGYGAPWTTHASGGEMLWLNGMCNEIWDSTQSHICLGPDVSASPDIKIKERCPGPGTKPWESVKTAIIYGWRPAQVHSSGSHGARLYTQMLEDAMKEGNYSLEYMRGLRTTVEHNHLLGQVPDVIEAIKKFGIMINVNTGYLREVPENIRDYGEQLMPFIMPLKTWINEGIRVTFEAQGTQFWRPIYRLVTREVVDVGTKNREKVVLVPEEAIDRVTALKMATTWASEYMFAEDTIGTLEPGKFADFAVLDRDFFAIPVSEIPDVEVVMTGLGGKIVYDPNHLAGGQ